jgi:hypothetical protein
MLTMDLKDLKHDLNEINLNNLIKSIWTFKSTVKYSPIAVVTAMDGSAIHKPW